MPHDTKQVFHGLVTNVAETQAPPGTLIEAENVVMRRPGCIEPRDGFLLVQTLASGFAAYGFSWRLKDFISRNNGSNVFNWLDTTGAAYQYTPPFSSAGDPQPMRRDVFSRAEARANLYLPYEGGVLKMETDSGPWKTAGIPHAIRVEGVGVNFGVDVSYGSWLPNNEQVGYRALVRRKDANLVETTSIPTGFQVFVNTTGVAAGIQLRLNVSQGIEWDELELYRTRNFPTSVTVDDEMQLVATIDKTAFGTVGFVYFLDYVDDVVSIAGKVLYTSPSRGGSNEQNNRPPACALTVLFRGSLFFCNIRGPRRLIESFTFQGGASGTISTATGIGRRSYTGTQTAASNVLTALSSTTGLEKGMRVLIDGTYRTITAIAGATATFSGAAAAGTSTTARVFHDAIAIDGVWYEMGLIGYVRPMPVFINFGLINVIVSEQTPPEGGHQYTYIFETLLRDTTAQTVQATHGSEYSPPLPNYDGTPEPMVQDAWPGAVSWSKPDEPEHVRPIDYEFVGDQNRATLGAIATRDALFLLKEDGVFRVTGANGDWRFDPVDPTARIVLPGSRWASVAVHLLTIAVSSGGRDARMFSAVNDLIKPIDQIVSAALGGFRLPGMQGAQAACVFDRQAVRSRALQCAAGLSDIASVIARLQARERVLQLQTLQLRPLGQLRAVAGRELLQDAAEHGCGRRVSAQRPGHGRHGEQLRRAQRHALGRHQCARGRRDQGLGGQVLADHGGGEQQRDNVPVALAGSTACWPPARQLYRSLRCSVIAGFTNPLPAEAVGRVPGDVHEVRGPGARALRLAVEPGAGGVRRGGRADLARASRSRHTRNRVRELRAGPRSAGAREPRQHARVAFARAHSLDAGVRRRAARGDLGGGPGAA
jgi:hypothetical protein